MAYQIFTDTSSGMSKALRKEYGIEYFRMGLNVAGEEKHGDLDYEEFSREQLYAWVKDPNVKITTSLVTTQEFTEKCEKYLKKGIDVLYIACTDALSGTRGVFELIKRDLEEKYPERTILSINSCRAEMALGLMKPLRCKKKVNLLKKSMTILKPINNTSIKSVLSTLLNT